MDARAWCERFFPWSNQEHHHTSLHLLTPADVQYGRAEEKRAQRQLVLERAYAAHPERFINRPPTMPKLAAAVWINPPNPTRAAPDSFQPPPTEPVVC